MANPCAVPPVHSQFKPFQSGNPGGRPKRLLSLIAEMIHKDGRHPYTELMALMPSLRPKEQAEVWLALLAYCQSKPKETAEEDTERSELSKLPLAELLQLVKLAIPELTVENPK